MSRSQISAFVSDETRARLERYVQAHGMKKAAVVERALLYHLQALDELPADILLPPRLLVTPETFERIVDRLDGAAEPTEAMKALFAGAPGEAEDPE